MATHTGTIIKDGGNRQIAAGLWRLLARGVPRREDIRINGSAVGSLMQMIYPGGGFARDGTWWPGYQWEKSYIPLAQFIPKDIDLKKVRTALEYLATHGDAMWDYGGHTVNHDRNVDVLIQYLDSGPAGATTAPAIPLTAATTGTQPATNPTTQPATRPAGIPIVEDLEASASPESADVEIGQPVLVTVTVRNVGKATYAYTHSNMDTWENTAIAAFDENHAPVRFPNVYDAIFATSFNGMTYDHKSSPASPSPSSASSTRASASPSPAPTPSSPSSASTASIHPPPKTPPPSRPSLFPPRSASATSIPPGAPPTSPPSPPPTTPAPVFPRISPFPSITPSPPARKTTSASFLTSTMCEPSPRSWPISHPATRTTTPAPASAP